MPLSSPSSRRALKHSRAIQVEAFARDDGLWDIDARVTDIKTRDAALASGSRPAGIPIHDLWLRLTVDTQLNVLDAEAVSDAVPYPGYCDVIGSAYKKLEGLNLLQGFRAGVKQRLGGILACTHLTELANVLPTAVIQAVAGEPEFALGGRDADSRQGKPFELDGCHALRSDGEAVAKYYPGWSVQAVPVQESIEC